MDIFAEALAPWKAEITLAKQLCFLFMFVVWAATVFWTWRDAYKRGAMAWFWALVVALFVPLFPLPGWIIYMIVRPPEYAEDVRERELEIKAKEAVMQRDVETCPACLKPVEKDYLICPSCMKKLRKQCTECGRALRLDWGVCPYCKTKQ